MSLRVEKLTVQEWETFRAPWNKLLEQSTASNPFLSWEWMWSWWESFSSQYQDLILKVSDGNRLVGIVPLCLRGQVIQFASAADLYPDYLDVIAIDGREFDVVQASFNFIDEMREWNKIFLDNLLPNSLILQSLPKIKKEWVFFQKPSNICPFVRLDGTMAEYMQKNFKKKKRYNLKRQVQIAVKENGIDFSDITSSGQIVRAVDAFFDLHEKRARSKKINSSILAENVKNFYVTFSLRAFESKMLKMSFMKKEDIPLAVGYTLVDSRKYYFLQSGVDPGVDKLSLGTVLLTLLIEDAYKKGMIEFDFLKGEESYKMVWNTGVRTEYLLQMWRPTFQGFFGCYVQKLKAMIGHWVK